MEGITRGDRVDEEQLKLAVREWQIISIVT